MSGKNKGGREVRKPKQPKKPKLPTQKADFLLRVEQPRKPRHSK